MFQSRLWAIAIGLAFFFPRHSTASFGACTEAAIEAGYSASWIEAYCPKAKSGAAVCIKAAVQAGYHYSWVQHYCPKATSSAGLCVKAATKGGYHYSWIESNCFNE